MNNDDIKSIHQNRSLLSRFACLIANILSFILTIYTFLSLILPGKLKIQQVFYQASCWGSIVFDFFMILKRNKSSKNKSKSLYYNIYVHHFINDLTICFAKFNSILFLISKLPIYLYRISKCFDLYISKKQSTFPTFLFHFVRNILKSVKLQVLRATMEILLFFYLFIQIIFTLQVTAVIAFLTDFLIFILLAYRVDPYHRIVWRYIIDTIDTEALVRTEKLKNLVYSNLVICDNVEFFGKMLYPIPYMY